MYDSNTSRSLRITAGIMGLMMLFIVLFSSFFIAAEADHDCSGEDCMICASIQKCENTLRSLGDGNTLQLSFIALVLFVLLDAVIPDNKVPQDTPVSRKVRLNN